MATETKTIILREGEAAGWAATNPVLNRSELAVVIDAVPPVIKLGDGVTAFADLPSILDLHDHDGTYQPVSTNLDAIAGLTTVADRLAYWTGSGTAALTVLTAFARNLLTAADDTAARTVLGLDIGTDVQGWSAVLQATTAPFTAADSARLAAMEDGATADLTGPEILALLLPVDGSGSGLDTDLFRGLSPTDFYRPGQTDVAVADGGTGASSAVVARTNLGLTIGQHVQGFSSVLAAVAAKTPTAFGLDFLEVADAAAARTILGVTQGGGGGDGFTSSVFYGSDPATPRGRVGLPPMEWVGYTGVEPDEYDILSGDTLVRYDSPRPDRVTVPTAVAGDEEAILTWTDPVNAGAASAVLDSIVIVRDGVDVATVALGVETFTDTGLTNGLRYVYQILAVNDGGYRSESGAGLGVEPVETRPEPPSDFVATPGDGEVVLTWTDPVHPNLVSISVRRDGIEIDTVAAGVETYTDTDVTNGVEYSYTLFATDSTPTDSLETAEQRVTPTGAGPASAPTIAGSGTADTNTVNLVVTVPAGTLENDILTVACTHVGTSNWTTPANWVLQPFTQGQTHTIAVFTKSATADDAANAGTKTYTFVKGAGTPDRQAAIVLAVRGATAVDATIFGETGPSNEFVPPLPALTTTVTNTRIVAFYGGKGETNNHPTPSFGTEVATVNRGGSGSNVMSMSCHTATQAAAGSSGVLDGGAAAIATAWVDYGIAFRA